MPRPLEKYKHEAADRCVEKPPNELTTKGKGGNTGRDRADPATRRIACLMTTQVRTTRLHSRRVVVVVMTGLESGNMDPAPAASCLHALGRVIGLSIRTMGQLGKSSVILSGQKLLPTQASKGPFCSPPRAAALPVQGLSLPHSHSPWAVFGLNDRRKKKDKEGEENPRKTQQQQ